jgi:hypothetical protein
MKGLSLRAGKSNMFPEKRFMDLNDSSPKKEKRASSSLLSRSRSSRPEHGLNCSPQALGAEIVGC